MFGEELILGFKEVGLDEKSRIFLPKFTGVEQGDRISFVEDSPSSLKLYNLMYMQQLISEINKKCNPENKEKVQQLSDRLQLLYYSYLATSKVDSHGRITIPQDIVNEYRFKDKIIVQGCGTNLTIFNSKDAYDSYVRKLKTTK